MPNELKPKIIKGDALNESNVDEAVKGQDAVLIVLGTRTVLDPTTVMSDGTNNILKAMSNHGVKKVVCCLSCKFIERCFHYLVPVARFTYFLK